MIGRRFLRAAGPVVSVLILAGYLLTIVAPLSLLPPPPAMAASPRPASPAGAAIPSAAPTVLGQARTTTVGASPRVVPSGNCNPTATQAVDFSQDVAVSINIWQTNASLVGGQFPDWTQPVSQWAGTVVVVAKMLDGENITEANLTVWAVGWNNQPLNSTLPNAPASFPMLVDPTDQLEAIGQLSDFKFFPPGSTVMFNLTIEVANTYTPDVLYSPCAAGQFPVSTSTPPLSPYFDEPTWVYTVGGGWPSAVFENDINITANPNIFTIPSTQPAPTQAVWLFLNSSAIGIPIGGANLYYQFTNKTGTHQGGLGFCPTNTTFLSTCLGGIATPIEPFDQPGLTISFHIEAWVTTLAGAYNFIWSRMYGFTVGSGGTWCGSSGILTNYLNFSSQAPFQDVAQSTTNDTLVPAFAVVNFTLASDFVNLSINYAAIFFNLTYENEPESNEVLMNAVNATYLYTGDGTQPFDPSDIGPFPAGTNVSLYVIAYDDLGCPIRSGTFHFHTAVAPPPVVNSRTYFYVVVFDEAKGIYVSGAPVNISNSTWTDLTQTNLFGFAFPNETGSDVPAYLAYGYYNVSVEYEGSTQSLLYDLSPDSNKTLTFIFDQQLLATPIYATASPPISLELVGGVALASVACVPLYFIWRDMRRKAEADEKRVTL